MGQTAVCGKYHGSVKEGYRPLLEEDDIQGFHDGLVANPILKNRFENVPKASILSMANKILEILRLSAREKTITPFLQSFDPHVLMNIKEAEIDTLFKLFLQECRVEGEIFWDQYENILRRIKKLILSHMAKGGYNGLKFYTEVKRNPILSDRFKTVSPIVTFQMMSDFSNIIRNPDPEEKIGALADSHALLSISEEEFDEFIKIMLMYSTDVDFAARVAPTVTLIKKVMLENQK